MATLRNYLTQHICNLTCVFRMSYEIRTNLSRLMRYPTYKNVIQLIYTLSLIFCNELEKDSDTERTMFFPKFIFKLLPRKQKTLIFDLLLIINFLRRY